MCCVVDVVMVFVVAARPYGFSSVGRSESREVSVNAPFKAHDPSYRAEEPPPYTRNYLGG